MMGLHEEERQIRELTVSCTVSYDGLDGCGAGRGHRYLARMDVS